MQLRFAAPRLARSVTVDPDGFPLVYTGSRDNRFRVLAIDRGAPMELWRLHAADGARCCGTTTGTARRSSSTTT